MIKFKNLTMKNFLSVGNVTQAIDLDGQDLILVMGENKDLGGNDSGSRNGVGKTLVSNAISYALFGQALNSIRKDNLINRTNEKNMLVTLDFEVSGKKYKIERGRKPSVMKFFVEGVQQEESKDESQGDSRETQNHITKILNMSHDMFKHIVCLNTYTDAFLNMKAADQRMVIEQLLGITILSEKAESLKELIKELKELISREEFKINTQKELNQKIEDQINALLKKQSQWGSTNKKELKRLRSELSELEQLDIDKELKSHEKASIVKENSRKKISLSKEIKNYKSSLQKDKSILATIVNKISILHENKCPECDQPVHDELNEKMRKENQEAKELLEESIQDQEQKLRNLVQEHDSISDEEEPDTFYDTLTQVYNHKNSVDQIKSKVSDLESAHDPYEDQIKNMRTNMVEKIDHSTLNEYQSLLSHKEFLLKILTNKDSFVRKKIIDQNLNYLNGRLSYYLEKIGLPHKVKFLNDLSVEISEMGRSLDFHNLSRGEMNRLILSMSWSFRDVWEGLYHPINFMMIDELLDNGTDAVGVENSLKILKNMVRERHKNLFLISHREELCNRVNNILYVTKENGYTTFSLDTI